MFDRQVLGKETNFGIEKKNFTFLRTHNYESLQVNVSGDVTYKNFDSSHYINF